MIPVKLTLRNFMSYGDTPTTLPFEGLHVACLSGDNGNGKSALLDAITWVLWNKTRASSTAAVSDDDLIRLGAEEVEVRFEFELNEQGYRVVRKRKRGRTGDWQLTQKNGRGDYVPVGGNSSRETARQLVQLLKMEYETFINSAYLQQGRADVFTRQKPTDRKRILGEILGLSQYDMLEAKAKERFNAIKIQAEEIAGEMRILRGGVERQTEYEEQLTEAEGGVASLEPQVTALEAVAKQWQEKVGRIVLVERQAQEQKAQRDRLAQEHQRRAEELAKKQEQLRRMGDLLAQREAITKDYERLLALKREREKLEPAKEQYEQAQQELQKAQHEIAMEKTRMEGELRLLQSRLQAIEQRHKESLRLEAEREMLTTEIRSLEGVTKTLEEARLQHQQASELLAELKTQNTRFGEEIAEIEEVLQVLEQPLSVCPVCDSNLNGTQRLKVIERQQERLREKQEQREQLKQRGTSTRQQVLKWQGEVQQAEAQQTLLHKHTARLNEIETRLHRLQEEGVDAAEVKKEAVRLNSQLESESFSPAKRIVVQNTERLLQELKPKQERYRELTTTLRNLEGAETRFQQLQNTEGNHAQALIDREALEENLKQVTAQQAEAEAKYQELVHSLSQSSETRQKALLAENELRELRLRLTSAQNSVASIQRLIADCEQAKTEYERRSKEYEACAVEAKHYNMLVSAFGKKGIQTMIIENVLPEIQDEANELLGRMTEGAMKLSINPTRDKKSGGGAIETLDIHITDNAGTRPYELFSGGEGFRVNFALRLALSRLLARRSGAKLETLIMDEGFGSQDGKGRERLVEVIEAVKEDFQKILVITHFEEVKDAFPQRIEVVKDANGSRIQLLE